jgi:hypothetical protein
MDSTISTWLPAAPIDCEKCEKREAKPQRWTVEGRGDTFAIVDEMDELIATVDYPEDATGDPLASVEGKRAILLAAAPELLAALENVAAELIGLSRSGDSITRNCPEWTMEQVQNAGQVIRLEAGRIERIARRAIAQAKGEAPALPPQHDGEVTIRFRDRNWVTEGTATGRWGDRDYTGKRIFRAEHGRVYYLFDDEVLSEDPA